MWAICDSFVLVDALHPAATAFVVAAEQGQSLDASLAAIVAAARQGRDAATIAARSVAPPGWVSAPKTNPTPATSWSCICWRPSPVSSTPRPAAH